ncbi:dynein regulatory complex subunit 7 isoform X2 [Pseudomyrmex gracilis]|uniref:dynein regulatory complex subunit 7 isoform X2 n=1 Tax=Pseudomyrmex gracilis TaxID=219809 RepID=UPI000994A526|nr:dynein regulatory complex subunit 7 isoform X2 [Pseudomyrmex gracilis]
MNIDVSTTSRANARDFDDGLITDSSSTLADKYWEDESYAIEKFTNDDYFEEIDKTKPDVRSAEEILQQVQRELCLIKLCWPDAPLTEDLYLKTLPDSYRCVNDKEKLSLWYAENFRRQFHAKFPDRRPLLLARENECGVQPRNLRSPTWVLHFQKGNSFEYATLLVSLLLGQGYNAFVVSGYASREQTLCDMTRKTCPYLVKPEVIPPKTEVSDIVNKYCLKSPPDFRSQFLLELEDREKKRVEAELKKQREEEQKLIDDFERLPPDEYFGRRIHAWVVILPDERSARNEEIIEPIFIEPSSGLSYSLDDDETHSLYLGVENIWNNQNYWVNMQRRGQNCKDINWDLSNVKCWEHLFPDEPFVISKDTEEIEEDIILQNKHLDMPTSYVSELHITSLDFEKRYPQGAKTILYKKAKVELYAPYTQNGLVQRVTLYEDYDYAISVESHEKYLHRDDCLIESKKHFELCNIMDLFEKGRVDQCKTHEYPMHDDDGLYNKRVIEFYKGGRFDGLLRIEVDPLYLTQYYVDREDFLYYRHTEFSTEKGNPALDGIHFRRISKIVEKYYRNETIPACKDVAEREFTMIENEVRLKFHYDKGRSTRATRTFIKPSIGDRGDRLIFDSSMTHGYNPDPIAPSEKYLDLFYDFDKHLKDEDHVISCVRDTETEIAEYLKRRKEECINLQFTISLFDPNRSKIQATNELRPKTAMDTELDVAKEINPVEPYLARIGNPDYVSKAQAYLLRNECLNDFKQMSVNKANRILRLIEKRSAELKESQVLLLQSEDLPKTEKEEILAKINQISFDINVLETYMNRHRNLVPQRYKKLLDRLRESSHLKVLSVQ